MTNPRSANSSEPIPSSSDHRFVAVTIGCGESFACCAKLAAANCEMQTGLPAFILGDEAKRRLKLAEPHHLKFHLFDEFPEAETILYFDADTIFLHAIDVRGYFGRKEFICVGELKNDATVAGESKKIGIHSSEYFNSGFFILNRTHHSKLLPAAKSLIGKIPTGFKDQTFLNAARATLGIPQILLPREFNHLRVERAASLETIAIGHFRWIDSKPCSMIPGYFDWWLGKPTKECSECARLAGELMNSPWNYERVGFDQRPMEFLPRHRIGTGRAGAEKFWELSMDEEGPVLWISGDGDTTMWARYDEAGRWSGRWIRHERMPVLFTPLPAGHPLTRVAGKWNSQPPKPSRQRLPVKARNGRTRLL